VRVAEGWPQLAVRAIALEEGCPPAIHQTWQIPAILPRSGSRMARIAAPARTEVEASGVVRHRRLE